MSKKLTLILLAVISAILFFGGYFLGKQSIEVKTITKHVYHERIVERPVVRDSVVYKDRIVYKHRIDTVKETETQYRVDTIFEPIPFEEKTYSDSLYEAQVSGYQPRLDWLRIQQKEIVRETLVEKNPHWSLTIGPSIGYSFLPERQPYIGVGIAFGYSLKNF